MKKQPSHYRARARSLRNAADSLDLLADMEEQGYGHVTPKLRLSYLGALRNNLCAAFALGNTKDFMKTFPKMDLQTRVALFSMSHSPEVPAYCAPEEPDFEQVFDEHLPKAMTS